VYQGQHEPILDRELFDAVGQALDASTSKRAKRIETHAPLAGLLFDADGHGMTPTHSGGRGGKRYSYYTSAPLQLGQRISGDDAPRRVPARKIEALLLERLRQWSARADGEWAVFAPWLRRIELH